jgi:hypothetical protein
MGILNFVTGKKKQPKTVAEVVEILSNMSDQLTNIAVVKNEEIGELEVAKEEIVKDIKVAEKEMKRGRAIATNISKLIVLDDNEPGETKTDSTKKES